MRGIPVKFKVIVSLAVILVFGAGVIFVSVNMKEETPKRKAEPFRVDTSKIIIDDGEKF